MGCLPSTEATNDNKPTGISTPGNADDNNNKNENQDKDENTEPSLNINQPETNNADNTQTIQKSTRLLKPELCVFGFIRRININQQIPIELIQICLSFWLSFRDKWNTEISHSSFTINNETGVIIPRPTSSYLAMNAFGSLIIEKGDIKTWKIKITNKYRLSSMNGEFGIIEYDTSNQSIYKRMKFSAFCHQDNTIPAYSYALYNGSLRWTGSDVRYKAYGKKCPKNNILSMTLDLTETESKQHGHLSFELNGKSFGIAFNDIDINKKYCMALAMFNDDILQLIE